MEKTFSFQALKFVRDRRNEMHKEWERDPKAFWSSVRMQGDVWRAGHDKKKKVD